MTFWKRWCAAVAMAGTLAGCATTGGQTASDPLEPFNRAMFQFNDGLDTVVFKPVGEAYRAVIPSLVRTGVTNFFSNIEDLWIGANNLLQGKVEEGLTDFMRTVVNTFFGLTVIDVASDGGMPKHNEDFGQTLGRWGFGSGPYLVLPFFGPSTARDGLGLVLDIKADPVTHLESVRARNSVYALRLVNTRANQLDATRVLEEAALDKYTFVRDSYLQRRRSLVHDGNPPREERSGGDAPALGGESQQAPPQAPRAAPAGSGAAPAETAVYRPSL